MNHVDLDAIADHLKTFTEITDICGQRVFTETPFREQDGIALVLELFGDPIDTEVSKKCGIGFRAIAHDNDVSQKQLRNLLNIVTEKLTGAYDFDTPVPTFSFGVFKVSEGSFSPVLVDDKGRWQILKDFTFYYEI